MVLAAKTRALAVINAFLVGLEPGLVHAARHGIHTDTERADREIVDHIGAENLHDNGLACRQHKLVIHCEQSGVMGFHSIFA